MAMNARFKPLLLLIDGNASSMVLQADETCHHAINFNRERRKCITVWVCCFCRRQEAVFGGRDYRTNGSAMYNVTEGLDEVCAHRPR